jgi:uncharacterized protein (DUF58 family)
MRGQDYRDLLKPEVLGSIDGLALIARVAVEGYFSGLNRSLNVGPGMEFSQYRGYEPGDDPRLLDWKMLARSGRYYIKQSEQESLVTVKFIVDASASMLHREGNISKADYARVLVATLSYLAHRQGDAVGLFALNDQDLISVYPRAGARQFQRLLMELLRIPLSGKWPEATRAAHLIPDKGKRELLFFITDMYERNTELSHFVKALKSPRNEVVVLQLMGKAEMDFDYDQPFTFKDLETGASVQVDAGRARKAYLSKLETRIQTLRDDLLGQGIGYQLFRLDQPLGETLHYYLKQRSRLN